MTILVTGATGTVGAEVLRRLSARGAQVRAGVRGARPSARTPAAVTQVPLDFADPTSVDAAMVGVERLFLLMPFSPFQVDQTRTIVESAARHGVRHVVRLSFIGADDAKRPTAVGRAHRAGELLVESAGIAHTSLRPTAFMQNFLLYAEALKAGTFAAPLAGAKVAYIDTRDIAEVAATVLTEEGHAGRTYPITGPAALSGEEVASSLGAALGRPVTFVSPTDDEAVAALAGHGTPAWLAEALVEMDAAKRLGDQAVVHDCVEQVTGHAPRSLADFLADHLDHFTQAAPTQR